MTVEPSSPLAEEPQAPPPPPPRRGFSISLREVLLVAMLLALLLAALTPWYRRRVVLAHVAHVRADMRTVATALEAYFIDDMNGPGCALAEGPPRVRADGKTIHMPWSVHHHLPAGSGARRTITFLMSNPTLGSATPHSLTTPIAYLQAYPEDPFADVTGATFGYYQENWGNWIQWSPGPDRDSPGDIGPTVERVYIDQSGPRPAGWSLAAYFNFFYDPTNGVASDGDIIRPRNELRP